MGFMAPTLHHNHEKGEQIYHPRLFLAERSLQSKQRERERERECVLREEVSYKSVEAL
jgi:hypothetical protein